ncbi:7-cyano-7-deazaguanine synthase QueC [candidate division KSB1 bacterium]
MLLSGGMDSLVTLAIALNSFKNNSDHIAVFHAKYGQRTEEREYKAFSSITRYYSITHRLITTIPSLNQIGGSSLTDKSISVDKADIGSEEIPSSYVPFRNAHFLTNAVSWAEVIGVNYIYIGAVATDSSGYPDCNREFYNTFESLIETGTKPETKIEIISPVIGLTKKEIILKGSNLNVPFHLTWSCYQNSEKACGTCESCVLRLNAFSEAGISDPIEYQK